MGRAAKTLGVMAAVFALSLGAAGAQERKVQFALTGTFMFGQTFEGEFGGWLGPGARVDISIGKKISLTPEVLWILYWRSVAPACLLNLRVGEVAYIGAGPLVTWTTYDREGVLALKFRLGYASDHVLAEIHYVTGRASSHTWGQSPRLLGVTLGYVF